ncbi:hypothetical protein KY285_035843 [Solanum tuberosum]|nr:hypothetical protein KY285_035843 [Solanum tuberosum]
MRVAGMARDLSVEPHRPPDQHPSERHDNGNNPQLSTLHYTSHCSSKSQDTDAVNTTFSKKELEGTRKFNSHDASGLNLGKVLIPIESTSPELQHSKNHSIPPFQSTTIVRRF